MVPMIGNIVTMFAIDFGNPKTWSSIASTSAEQTITVPGLKTTDRVIGITKPTVQAGLAVAGGRVSAADTLAICFITSGGTVTPTANEVYTVFVARPEKTITDANA